MVTAQALPRDVRVAIIGAGFGGLCAAIRLKQSGITDFVVLERERDVGGTWQVNTYPGAQCDVPSIVYSFSFAPNPRWSRWYPLQPEIRDYLRRCAEQFGVLPDIRFGHEVRAARWDEQAQRWRIQTNHGPVLARFLVAAMGPFSAPSTPDFPGLARFAGKMFHSAAWDHEHDLTGERVAVIGTGASAVQFIPHVQPRAAHLTVFQRTPIWVAPHPDRPVGVVQKTLFTRFPPAQRLARAGLSLGFEALVPGLVRRPNLLAGLELLARKHLRRQVRDPELRAKLTPDYRFGCKRPTFSNTYYPALTRPNVEVVSEGVDRISAQGVVTADGVEHAVDTIILGTGFRVVDHPMFGHIHGRDGHTLAELWRDDPRAYLGTMVSGLPNLFVILGPNSAPYTSQVITIEAQVEYILSCVHTAAARRLSSVDVRPEVQRAFNDTLDRRLRTSVWATGGCQSYYIGNSGRIISFWPGFAAQFTRRTRRIDLADHHVVADRTAVST